MCQSHTGRLTGLWFLPKPAFGLNTNDDDDIYSTVIKPWIILLVNIDAINLKFLQVSMIEVSGKPPHYIAYLRTGTSDLIKLIFGTALLLIILTSLHRQPHRYCFSLRVRRTIITVNIKVTDGQPIMISQFRYVSVSEFLRLYSSENQPRICLQHKIWQADVSDSLSSPGCFIWQLWTFLTFWMNLLVSSWR